jgi:hypothetical protein
MSLRQWDNRESDLLGFMSIHASMWTPASNVSTLIAPPFLESMKAPKAKEIIKYFRLFGIQDIFASITHTTAGRNRLVRGVEGLVDSRNGIAHGDQTVMPVRTDLTVYVNVVRDFCSRADRVLCKELAQLTGQGAPW